MFTDTRGTRWHLDAPARRAVGTSQLNGPQIWQISDPTSGIPLASRSSHSCGARRIRGEVSRGTVGRGAEILARHPSHLGLAMFMASASLVRRATLQPFVANSSTTTVRRMYARASFGNAANDGSVVGEDPWKLEAGRNGKASPPSQ